MQCLHSSGVSLETLMVSMTMASGSWVLVVKVLEKEWYMYLGGFGVPPGNVVSLPPLSLEDDGFLVPIVDGRWYHIHGHDVAH